MEKPSFHASFKAVLNLMTGCHVFTEPHILREVEQIVLLLTGASPSNEDVYRRQVARVRTHFCNHFSEIWDQSMRQKIDFLKRILIEHSRKGEKAYRSTADRWLDDLEKKGFTDLVFKPINDGKGHLFSFVVVKHQGGVVKHKQGRQQDISIAV